MKNFKLFAAALFVAFATAFAACDNVNDPEDSTTQTKGSVDPSEIDTVAPYNWDSILALLPTGAKAVTCAEAIKIGNALSSKDTTPDYYYIYGIVKKNSTTDATIASYGNQLFFMVDKTTDESDFECYQVYNIGRQRFKDLNQIEVGDHVIVYSRIYNYGTQIETTGKGSAYVWWSDNKNNEEQ